MSGPKAAMLIDRAMQRKCFSEKDLARIHAVTDLVESAEDCCSPGHQQRCLKDAVIAITGWGALPLTADVLKEAPQLRLICHAAGSIRGLVPGGKWNGDICISSARAALARGTAEYAFGLMLMATKMAWLHMETVRRGGWRDDHIDGKVRELFGATVGVIGASHVGRHFIRLCRMLRVARILLYDPYCDENECVGLGTEKASLNELMQASDVVSVHLPATEETHHMLDAAMLALMKDGGILVNTARGQCIDEGALLVELERGRIFACLDVTDPEPPAADSSLRTLPNVVLSPHIAGALNENCLMQGEIVADEIEAFVAGLPLKHLIDPENSDRIA